MGANIFSLPLPEEETENKLPCYAGNSLQALSKQPESSYRKFSCGFPLSEKKILARSEKCDTSMLLDVNTEIYPIDKNEKFVMVLTLSLSLKTKDGVVQIHDKFEYIMHGRLYKITDGEGSETGFKVEIYVSFGGLQLKLSGVASHCLKLALDQNLFLLMRKVP